ncbi:endonuclease/exonuclease/phosphatase family protein [uncultured Formosa sp.]|uniref:endonuclease/exonuclease/phosphatase family protein n=1 Tax=uncultured Formosa sp. TaxID=255435 RepID=UPI002605821C|nr:endonuclease/exonuclease/phosphatase family protein [uncultured Formosa sp.]
MIQLLFKYKTKAYILFWYAFLLLIHFVIKDRLQPFVFIFNACSLLVIIIYGIVVALFLYKHKALLISILAINCLLGVYWYNNYHYKTDDITVNTASINTKSILFWNISRPKNLPLEDISKKIKAYRPEILAFVEAKNISEDDLSAFKKQHPLYNIQQLEGEMMIAVKGEINTVVYKKISRGSKNNFVTVTINNTQFKILINDLFANPALSKKAEFESIKSLVKSENIDFIVGDFNTPYESLFFKTFKSNFESFHKYNNGFTATWPSLFPILEIDHIWISKTWQPIILHKEFNNNSDHGLLVGTYQLRP